MRSKISKRKRVDILTRKKKHYRCKVKDERPRLAETFYAFQNIEAQARRYSYT